MFIVYETENKYAENLKGKTHGSFITREAAEKRVLELNWLEADIIETDCVYEAQSYEPEYAWEKEPEWENYVSDTRFYFVSPETAEAFAKQYKFWNVRKCKLQEQDCNDYAALVPTVEDMFAFLDET